MVSDRCHGNHYPRRTGAPEGMMLAILLMNIFAPLIDYVVVQNNISPRKRYVQQTEMLMNTAITYTIIYGFSNGCYRKELFAGFS